MGENKLFGFVGKSLHIFLEDFSYVGNDAYRSGIVPYQGDLEFI